MQQILDNLALVFTFLFARLGEVGAFFVSTNLGLIILGVVIFALVVEAVALFIKR